MIAVRSLAGMAACGVAATMLCGFALAAAPADPDAARLRAAALAEEAGLLVEEWAALEPLRQNGRSEAEQIAATERKLSVEVRRMQQDLDADNKAVAALRGMSVEHARECPSELDESQVEPCNERGAVLMDRAAELDRRYLALSARQRELNAQIEQNYRARAALSRSRQEAAPKLDVNAADIQRWVNAARPFMATRDFTALVASAGKPAACTQLRLGDANGFFGKPGLDRLHACLRAVLGAG